MEKKKSAPKRKSGDDGDDVVVVDEGGGGGGGGGEGGKKAPPKKAKAAEKAPPKPKAPPKLKPFTPEDEEIAKGASMERNKAMATYLESIWTALKEEVGMPLYFFVFAPFYILLNPPLVSSTRTYAHRPPLLFPS
jgi:hypothetical protein